MVTLWPVGSNLANRNELVFAIQLLLNAHNPAISFKITNCTDLPDCNSRLSFNTSQRGESLCRLQLPMPYPLLCVEV